jgi:hypothetical protein
MNVRALARLLVLILLMPAERVHAQCSAWEYGPLDNGTGPNGADGAISATISWDPDGAGPLAPRLVVGGLFTSIGGVAATNIAQRDPATGIWSPLGSGINSGVGALTVFNGQLVAGCSGDNNVGTFDATVRKWDGTTWQNFPATNTGSVTALQVYNGALYIGGSFMTQFTTSTGPAFYIARYNAIANLWDTVEEAGFGGQTNTGVSALADYNGDLYVGGWIKASTITGSALRISHGNSPASWAAITDATDPGGVYAFGQFSGDLIVAGGFNTINGVGYSCIAGWNGSSFHSYGSGTGGAPYGGGIYSVTIHNGIVIGGVFTTASGAPANHVAFWPPGGSSWQALGGGTDNSVYGLVSYNGELVAGGAFTVAEVPANHIAHWDGYQWGPFGGGSGNYVLAVTNFNGRVVAGGAFDEATPAFATAHNIAGWTGSAIQAFGAGMNGAVWALKGFSYPGPLGSTELVAGGTFSQAGGITANNIARWNESQVAFPPPAWAAMGPGFNNAVYAIERSSSRTYAAGAFTFSGGTGVSYIARWNETTKLWEAVGSGMNGFVYALKDYNGYLYAGGNFTTAGGVSTGGLARWNGTSWSAVGGYFLGTVLSLTVYNGQLVMGGQFTGINSSPNLAQYTPLLQKDLGTT